MSKIEKAIKKAQALRKNGNSLIAVENKKKSDDKQLTASNNSLVKSSRLNSVIKNMEEGKCLSLEQLIDKRIIFPEMYDGKVADSYRSLRTKLLQKSKGENFIVLVTSCIDGLDASYVALNLSAAFSLDESKTSLLIDCNLSKPKIDYLLGLNTKAGLADYLNSDDLSVDQIIQSAGLQRLRVIPAGAKKESTIEYFTSNKMKSLLDSLIDRYEDRFIFVDSPPVAESADSKILMDFCDFIILVVPYGRVAKNVLKESLESLDEEKFVGIVMNEMPSYIG